MIRRILALSLGSFAILTAVGWVISLDGEYRWAHVSPDGVVVRLSPPKGAHTHILLCDGSVSVTHKVPVPPTSIVPTRSFEFCGLYLRAGPSARPLGVIPFDPNFDPEAEYLKHRKLERWVSIPLWMPLLLFLIYPLVAFARGPLRRLIRHRTGRCPSCGYNLTGNVSGVCPECGEPVEGGT